MSSFGILRPLFVIAAATTLLAGCGPPDKTVISQCRMAAARQAMGRGVDPNDVGELIEACMMVRGFAVREDGPLCADDTRGPASPACYYPDTLPGRLAHWMREFL